MAQCIGNCIRCELVPNEEKVTCCSFQSLRQLVEIRSQLKAIQEKLADKELSQFTMEVIEADPPAAEQEQINKRGKK